MTITWGECGHPLRPSKSHRAGAFCLVCDCLAVEGQATMRMHRTEDYDARDEGREREGTYGAHARMLDEWRGREDEANAWVIRISALELRMMFPEYRDGPGMGWRDTFRRFGIPALLVEEYRAIDITVINDAARGLVEQVLEHRKSRHLTGYNDRWLPQENYLWQEAMGNIGWTGHEVADTIARICLPSSRGHVPRPFPSGITAATTAWDPADGYRFMEMLNRQQARARPLRRGVCC